MHGTVLHCLSQVALVASSAWTAKDVIIVVAAVGFVALLVVGAFIVRRRGDSEGQG
jgi:hypothetical protein